MILAGAFGHVARLSWCWLVCTLGGVIKGTQVREFVRCVKNILSSYRVILPKRGREEYETG